MNWLSPDEGPSDSNADSNSESNSEINPEDPPPMSTDPDIPEESTLNYWASRLRPLHDPAPGYMADPSTSESLGQSEDGAEGKEVIFVACNRVGTEEGMFDAFRFLHLVTSRIVETSQLISPPIS